MSLRILFADDSMTAQNMGKKILSEAGYEVVAVSNGAAAVKKIAEQKPDIIILDVYMPGYSGLEVCEKVRGSLDTMKIPVLLTVGKMEPYKPEDANRVKADGVIIKPFEASDLLAIMKKFEERVEKMAVPPIVAQTVPPESRHQEEAVAVQEPTEHHSPRASMQPMVEVPDHMAGAAAFNDMLGADSSIAPQHFGVSSPSAAFETSVIVPAPPIPTAEYELPVSWKEEEKPEPVAAAPAHTEHEIAATPVEAAPEPVAVEAEPETVAMEPLADPEASPVAAEASSPSTNDVAAHSHPQFIPVYKEPEPASSYEVMPTSAPPTGEIDIPREPELQETADETTRATVADHVEPGLLSTFESVPEAALKAVAQEHSLVGDASNVAAEEPSSASSIHVAPSQSDLSTLHAVKATGEVSDADFEARVAAAMAAYSQTTAPAEAQENASAAPAEDLQSQPLYAAQAAAPAPLEEAVPSFEYRPPVQTHEPIPTSVESPAAIAESVAEAASANSASVSSISSSATPTGNTHQSESSDVHEVVTAGVEAAAVAAATETGADHHNIAQAVHRVMERLKPELVEEIMRELRSRK
ncbi:MAG: response regulator [Candidatus Angelobacter sp.]